MVKDEKYSSKIKKYNYNKSDTIVDKKIMTPSLRGIITTTSSVRTIYTVICQH